MTISPPPNLAQTSQLESGSVAPPSPERQPIKLTPPAEVLGLTLEIPNCPWSRKTIAVPRGKLTTYRLTNRSVTDPEQPFNPGEYDIYGGSEKFTYPPDIPLPEQITNYVSNHQGELEVLLVNQTFTFSPFKEGQKPYDNPYNQKVIEYYQGGDGSTITLYKDDTGENGLVVTTDNKNNITSVTRIENLSSIGGRPFLEQGLCGSNCLFVTLDNGSGAGVHSQVYGLGRDGWTLRLEDHTPGIGNGTLELNHGQILIKLPSNQIFIYNPYTKKSTFALDSFFYTDRLKPEPGVNFLHVGPDGTFIVADNDPDTNKNGFFIAAKSKTPDYLQLPPGSTILDFRVFNTNRESDGLVFSVYKTENGELMLGIYEIKDGRFISQYIMPWENTCLPSDIGKLSFAKNGQQGIIITVPWNNEDYFVPLTSQLEKPHIPGSKWLTPQDIREQNPPPSAGQGYYVPPGPRIDPHVPLAR